MGSKRIGIVLAADGEKQFSQSLSNARKESNQLKSELTKLSTEYKGNANSLEFLSKKQENLAKQTESYQKRVASAQKGLENAQNVTKKASERYEELSKSLKEAQDAQKKMQDSGQEGTKEYQSQAKKVEELQKALEKQGLECQKCEGKVSDWSKRVNDAETDVEKNSQALKQNAQYLEEAKKATDNCATSIDSYGKKVKDATKTTSDWKEKFESAVATKGIDLAVDAFGALKDKAVEAAEYAVEVGSSFEAGMSEVAAISGATGSELEALENKAKELGSSTKFSATEAASAMTNMSLAGWSVDQTLSGIDGVMQLAAASGMDLADASQIVTDNISSFGLKAADAAKIADMMAYAQANSSTTAAELGEAYKNCGANMNAAGQDIETTTSMLEALANNGLRGSEAGTALAAVMRDMTSKMKDGKIAIGDTSVKVMDSNGNFRDMTDILKDVESATDGMGDAQKQAALMSTFTSDSIKGLNMLLSTGSDQVAGYEVSLRNCSGAASDMAEVMQDNLQGKLTELSSAAEGLGIAAYDYISGPLQGGVELLTDIVSGLTDAITPQKDTMDEMYDDIIQSSEKLKDNMQSIDEQFTGTMDSADRVGSLSARLEELNNVQDRTTVQRQEMAAIVAELSQSIPELQGAYDSENDTLSVTNEELEKLVQNYQDVAVQRAYIKATQDLVDQSLEAQKIKDQAEAQKESISSRLELLQNELDLINKIKNQNEQMSLNAAAGKEVDFSKALDYKTEALKMYKAALDDGTITLEEYEAAEKAINDGQMEKRYEVLTGLQIQNGEATGILATSVGELQDQEDELNGTIDTQKQTLKDIEKTKEEYAESAEHLTTVKKADTESTEENTEAQEENADAVKATGVAAAGAGLALEGFNKTMEESQEAADTAKDAMRQIIEAYNSTMDSIKADLQNKISFADKFDGGDDLTTEKMNENLQSWIDGLNNYQQNLQRIREMTDESGQAIFSPEFIQAIESQGTDAANVLQHMVWTFDNQGEYGIEQLKGINDKYMQTLDITDETATVMAANQTAYELAMGKLGSTSFDFSDLRDSIDLAVSSAAEGWSALPEKTREELEQTIQTAQECGVQIPDGLADGIKSGEITPQQALNQLNGTIEGTIQGLAEVARQSGLQIPQEIQDGINAGGNQAVTAMQELLTLIQQQAADAQAAGEEVGAATGEGVQSAIKEKQSGVEEAGSQMGSAGAKAADEKKSEYKAAGSTAAAQYQEGLASGKAGAISEASSMAMQAVAAVRTYQNSFYTAGYNMAQGVASGIAAGQAQAIAAAVTLAKLALAAAKAELGIHSPSKRFQNEVGKMIPAGTAQGIVSNQKVATDAASKMSQAILQNATGWLEEYRKNHESSIENEKWFWKQILSVAKKGSAEYQNARAPLNSLNNPSTISNAASEMIRTGFSVSGANEKGERKDEETYYSEMYSAAEKWLDRYKTLHATSLEQERDFWIAVRTQIHEGTDGWYEATKQIQKLDNKIAQEQEKKAEEREKKAEERQKKAEERQKKAAEAKKTQATVQDKLLDTYKTYYNVSAKAEMQYWNIARKQFKAGTDERIAADKKYLEAKKEYEKQKADLDQQYKEQREKLEKELNDTIKGLQDQQQQLVTDRKKDILSSMSGFDAWDATGYTADTMLYNMNTQVEGLKLWKDQLNELGQKGLSEDLMEELKAMGPEAAANIYTLNHMTTEQLEQFQNAWKEKNKIAEDQAKKDTEKERNKLTQQIDDTKAEYKKKFADIKTEYKSSLKDLNESLNEGLQGLVKNAGKIGEDMVGALIAGIQKGGAAGTLLNLNVQPSGQLSDKDKLDAINSGKSIPMDKREFSMPGGGSGYLADPAEEDDDTDEAPKTPKATATKATTTKTSTTKKSTKASTSSTTKDSKAPEAAKKKITDIINSGDKHAKTVSAEEKKAHSDLWQYIVKKYGRILSTANTKKVAKELGISASSKPTPKEKTDILNALKKKGLKTGTRNLAEDQLAWMFENNKQEYVLRKSDGAIMQNMLTGDKVINPKGAENLYNFAMNPDQFLDARSSMEVSSAGIEKLNRLIDQQSAGQVKLSGNSKENNADILNKMDSMMSTMESLVTSVENSIKNLKVVMDKDALIGEIIEDVNAKNEMAAIRYTRGRLR